jgi:hypothetical protein
LYSGLAARYSSKSAVLDLEGIVAKQKFGPYVTEREHTTWFKILNREYSQKDGREELFGRERHCEPVTGWHSCVLACVESEEEFPSDQKLRWDLANLC